MMNFITYILNYFLKIYDNPLKNTTSLIKNSHLEVLKNIRIV
jgi:hypothetical protein